MQRTFLLAALLLSPLAFARVDPAAEIEKLPEVQDEADLWESASRHENRLRNSGTVFHDRDVERYLESLADRMLGDHLDHLGIRLDFVLVSEPTLSGWVYPYGTIALHTGLMVRMDNEAQLGAIMAHEISHFLQRHTYSELIVDGRQSALGKGLGFLAGLAVARETGRFDPNVMDFAGDIWTNLATSGYSKKNEYRADEQGLELMAKAGWELDEAIPAFQALAENEVYGAGDPRKLWSSHPRLEDRIDNLEKEIRREKRRREHVPGSVPDADDYYRGIAPILKMNAKLDINETKYQRARDALDKYLRVRPDDPEAHYLVGETYRRENPLGPDFSDAIGAWEATLARDERHADAWRELGLARRILGETVAAREALERYVELAPGAADAGIVRWYLESL